MSVLAPSFGATEYEPVGDWYPARYPPPLTGDEATFTTEGDKLLRAAAKHWRMAEGELLLDPWQTWLIRRLLETYPPDWPVVELRGQLRYKIWVVSLARQNGKSLIGALLLFYWLTMHVKGPKIGSFASVESQAKVVYNRLWFAIDKSAALKAALKHTKTRGIEHRDGGGIYSTFPAKEDSLQGEPFSACLYDELHLGNLGLWEAIKIGQRSKRAAQLGGITTAGDDDSLLLKRLYGEGADALAAADEIVAAAAAILASAEGIASAEYERLTTGDERFGFFVWEAFAEEGADPELTEANVIRANPAVACGRIPLNEVMADSRKTWVAGPDEKGVLGRDRVIRYTLNRFLEGSADAWVSAAQFSRLGVSFDALELSGPTVYGINRTPNWEHASITANRVIDGHRYTELVATINDANEDQLYRACKDLASLGDATFAMPSSTLRALGLKLRENGYETWILGVSEMQEAYAKAKAAVQQRTLTHANDPLVRQQSGRAKARETDDGARISQRLSTGDVDSILAMITGLFVADATATEGTQLF